MPRNREHDVWHAAWADALHAASIGWDLGVPICGGAVLGHYLDRRLGTGYVMTMGLLLLGVMVGFYNVGRKIQQVIELDRYRAAQQAGADRCVRPEEDTTCQESSGSHLGQA